MNKIKRFIVPGIITMIITAILIFSAWYDNQADGAIIKQQEPIVDLFENARIPREGHYLLNQYYLVIEEFRQINRCMNDNDLDNAKVHFYRAEDIWAVVRTIPMPTDTITSGLVELKNKILASFDFYLINDIDYGTLAIQEFYKLLDDYYYYLYD
jgi:hypothetical protein